MSLVICKHFKENHCLSDCKHSIPHEEDCDCTTEECGMGHINNILCTYITRKNWSKEETKSINDLGNIHKVWKPRITWEEVVMIINKRHNITRSAEACRKKYNSL